MPSLINVDFYSDNLIFRTQSIWTSQLGIPNIQGLKTNQFSPITVLLLWCTGHGAWVVGIFGACYCAWWCFNIP